MKNKGISLIVLVITIIVIIILAGAVILNLTQNNPIDTAKIAALVQEKESLDSSLMLYVTKQTTKTNGDYSASDIIKGIAPNMEALVDTSEEISTDNKSIYLAKEDKVKEILDISLKNKLNSKWYIDTSSSKFYLVYDDTKNYDTYLGNYDEETGMLESSSVATFIFARNKINGLPNEEPEEPTYIDFDESKGVNKPKLTTGMVPIGWNESGSIIAMSDSNSEWYDYTNKKWANVATIDRTKTIDHSGNGHIGTLNGPTQQENGLLFDGTNDYIRTSDSLKSYNFGSKITLFTVFSANKLGIASYLIGNWEGGGGGIYINSSNHLFFELYIGGAYVGVDSGIIISLNKTYTVVATYDGSNLKIYVDGQLKAQKAKTGNIGVSAAPFGVGANVKAASGVDGGLSSGIISYTGAYNRALTAAEISANYADSGSINIIKTNLLFGYKLKSNLELEEGTKIALSNINSMWVWIPRYEYKIQTPNSSTSQEIDINFKKDKEKNVADGYILHPGFTFGNEELTGIWISKFEASGTSSAIDIKPSATAIRSITIGAAFTACRNMETNNRYGFETSGNGIDTHLMKNIEWGVISYLSSSKYGKNSEVWINPNSSSLTGQSGTSANSASTTSTYAYNNTQYGINASSTGNVYGIYDLSGGVYEYTATYLNNDTANLVTYGQSLINSEEKYKEIYLKGSSDTKALNYSANINKKGDSILETSSSGDNTTSWHGDQSYMVDTIYPFFVRGGHYGNTGGAGAFAFSYANGSAINNIGFRPVLVVEN